MQKLEKIEVDNAVDEYLRGVFGSAKGLAHTIGFNPAKWQVSAIVPKGTSLSRIKNTESGGLMNMDDSADWVAKLSAEMHKKYADGWLIFQDLYASPHDVNRDRIPDKRYCSVNDSVYYILSLKDADFYGIRTAWRHLISFLPVIFLTSKISVHPPFRYEFEQEEAAKNTIAILVGAYDEEGFLLLERRYV